MGERTGTGRMSAAGGERESPPSSSLSTPLPTIRDRKYNNDSVRVSADGNYDRMRAFWPDTPTSKPLARTHRSGLKTWVSILCARRVVIRTLLRPHQASVYLVASSVAVEKCSPLT